MGKLRSQLREDHAEATVSIWKEALFGVELFYCTPRRYFTVLAYRTVTVREWCSFHALNGTLLGGRALDVSEPSLNGSFSKLQAAANSLTYIINRLT